MFQRLSARKKPVVSVHEIASAISNKLFKEEITRSFLRMREHLADTGQLVGMHKFNLVITSLFIFIVDNAAHSVFGDSNIKNKIQKAFYSRIKEDFKEHNDLIFELSEKFHSVYKEQPDEPLLGLGICFSGCINKKNKNDVLCAMAGISEAAKKHKIIRNYFEELNVEFRIS